MKKIIIFILLSLFCITLFAQSFEKNTNTEISIYNEILSYKATDYYPGIIEKVDFLQKNYPESVFITKSLVLKGESLFNLNRYEEAEKTLLDVIPSMHLGSQDFSKSYCLLGKSFYYQEKYEKALDAFYKTCSICVKEEKYEYYDEAMLFAGRIFYLQKDYKSASEVLEYVISNGKKYNFNDYEEALQKLFTAYLNTNEFTKIISLFEQLDDSFFSHTAYSFLMMNVAEAYEKSNNPQKAYELYNKLIGDEDKNVSVIALKKAYVVASKNKIDVEPESILNKIIKSKSDDNSIIADFWVRLGIDFYNQKEFDKTEECFKLARENFIDGQNKEDELIIELYEKKIVLEKIEFLENRKENALKIEKELLVKEKEFSISSVKKLSDSYYSLLIYCMAVNEKWAAINEVYEKISSPDSQTILLEAYSLYKQQKWLEAEKIIITNITETENQILYAEIEQKLGKYTESESIYEKLFEENQLNHNELIEYSKVLFYLKKWDESKKVAEKSQNYLSNYIQGLCELQLGNYILASEFFERYINQNEKKYIGEAFYYQGFSLYKAGDYQKAYKSFVSVNTNDSLSKKIKYKAYNYAAKSALLCSDFKNAVIQAEAQIVASENDEDRYNATVFCSQIYVDNKDYEKAALLFEPYVQNHSEKTINALLQLANIYEDAGLIEKAEKYYVLLYTDYKNTQEAESALFRCGELYYSSQNYEKAEAGFTKYIYTYVDGRFSDAAYYFSGECNYKLGNVNQCIMQNKTLLSKYPKSIYCYGALKNLLKAYYDEELYSDALKAAEKLIVENEKQAKSDGIDVKITEIKQIISGKDRRIVEKESEFLQKGQKNSVEGRIAGTELVEIYLQFEQFYEKGVALSKELLALQAPENKVINKNEEALYGARNAEVVAGDFERKGVYGEAANMYLKAAEYYRLCGTEQAQNAAASLYSATSSFVLAGLHSDSKETAALLKSLYPDSKQSKKVDAIIK